MEDVCRGTGRPEADPGRIHYRTAYSDPEIAPLLLNSFAFAAGSAVLSLLLAGVMAWIVVRTNAPGAGCFELIAVVPNIVPPLLIAVAWTLLLNPTVGLLNLPLMGLFGLSGAPFNINYSLPGMIFVEGLILTPLAFLIIAAALRSMDPAYHLWLDGLHGRMGALGVLVTLLCGALVLAARRLGRSPGS